MPAPPRIERLPEPPELIADEKTISHGKALYHEHCYVCHGLGAEGGGVLPDQFARATEPKPRPIDSNSQPKSSEKLFRLRRLVGNQVMPDDLAGQMRIRRLIRYGRQIDRGAPDDGSEQRPD